MTRRKKPAKRGRKKGQKPSAQHFRVLLAFAFLVAFLIGALVLIGQLRENWRPEPPVSEDRQPSREQLLGEIRFELESALLRSGIGLDALHDESTASLSQLRVVGAPLEDANLSQLQERLQRLSPQLSLIRQGEALEVRLAGQPCYRLQFQPPPPPTSGQRPQLAIIMDDLGRDLGVAREMLALDLQVTFAILPDTSHASQIATLAHRRGREVIVHIPMEPQGYPAVDPGKGALFTNLGADEIRRRFLGYLDRIPYAVGGNNHMGSKFTMDVDGMHNVLQVMKEEGLFFVDSRTTGGSVAMQEARRLAIPGISRDVFLDNVAEVEPIVTELHRLVKLARQRGVAVGICHPYPATVKALSREMEFLKGSGVDLVPVSRLVRP